MTKRKERFVQLNGYMPINDDSKKNNSDKKMSPPVTHSMMDVVSKMASDEEVRKWKKELNLNTERSQTPKDDIDVTPQPVERTTYKPGAIRTFKADMQNLVQKNKLSVSKMLALESDRRQHKELKQKKRIRHFNVSVIMFALSIIFFSVSLLSGYLLFRKNVGFTLYSTGNNTLTPAATSLLNNLLFIEDRIRIDVTNKPRLYVLNILAAARDSTKIEGVPGNVIEFELVDKVSQDKYVKRDVITFVKDLYSDPPPTFTETLGKRYMSGVHITENGRKPFVILTTNSYHYGVSGMLNWEKTMEADIGIFLIPGSKISEILPVESDVTKFKDMVMQNYSLRVLLDENGNPKIVYGFLGDDTIIITNNTETFSELANRIRVTTGK